MQSNLVKLFPYLKYSHKISTYSTQNIAWEYTTKTKLTFCGNISPYSGIPKLKSTLQKLKIS